MLINVMLIKKHVYNVELIFITKKFRADKFRTFSFWALDFGQRIGILNYFGQKFSVFHLILSKLAAPI